MAGIEVDTTGIVIQTAPIFKWMLGKHMLEIEEWKNIKTITMLQEGG